MTRKRFTKLLMGLGFQRNVVEVFAYWKRKWRKPYAKAWSDYVAATLSCNPQSWRHIGELNEETVLRNLNYLELHKDER